MGLQSNPLDSTRKRFWEGYRRQSREQVRQIVKNHPLPKAEEAFEDFRPAPGKHVEDAPPR